MKKAFFAFGLALVVMVAGFTVYPANHTASADEIVTGTTEMELPEGVDFVTDIKAMSNGELILLGANRLDKTLTQYVSTDEGESWTAECEYLEKLPLDMSQAEAVEAHGYLSDDGYVAISVETMKKHFWKINAETEPLMGAELYTYILNPEGEIIEVQEPETEEYGGYFKACFAGKRLYFHDVRGNLYQVDRDTGALIGQVMENGTFYSAEVAADGDELQVIPHQALGHPFNCPFPGEDIEEELLIYACASEAVKDNPDTAYVVDLDGIHIYSKDAGKTTIWENNREDFNKYSYFYDITALDDNTFFVDMFNEKLLEAKLVKIQTEQ